MKRLATGLTLALVALAAIRYAPPWFAETVVAALAVGCAVELGRLLGRVGLEPWPAVAIPGAVVAGVAFVLGGGALQGALAGLLLAGLGSALVAAGEPRERLRRFAGTIASALYLGLTFGHVAGLLAQPANAERGRDLLMLAVLAVYAGDVGAYYGGRALGRHRLAPRLSPGKTVEGAVCGVALAAGAALLAPLWFFRALPWGHALALGAAAGSAGILGDLAESLFKRAAEVKDSGALLPGHGGLLDRLDSLLFAAPVVYWYARLVADVA